MSSATARVRPTEPEKVCVETTLLELVRAVSETTEDDREVVHTILHMLRAGSVRLCGNFRDEPIEQF